MINKAIFLGYMVSASGLSMDEEKIKTILDWPTPRSFTYIRSFHDLVSFCHSLKILAPLLQWWMFRRTKSLYRPTKLKKF